MTDDISPTPWHWHKGTHYSTLVDAQGEYVLWYTTNDDGVHCKKANKPIIAAAPELLEACEALEFAEIQHANCKECDGAIPGELCSVCFPLFDDARLKRRAAIAKAREMESRDE